MTLLIQPSISTVPELQPDVFMIPNRTNVTVPPEEPDIVAFKVCYGDADGSHYHIKLVLTRDNNASSKTKEGTLPTDATLFTHDNTKSVGYSFILMDLPRDNDTVCQEASTRLYNSREIDIHTLRIELELIHTIDEHPTGKVIYNHYFFDITMADHDSFATTTPKGDDMTTHEHDSDMDTTELECPPCIDAGTSIQDPTSITSVIMGAIIAVLIVVIIVLCCFLCSHCKRKQNGSPDLEDGLSLEAKMRNRVLEEVAAQKEEVEQEVIRLQEANRGAEEAHKAKKVELEARLREVENRLQEAENKQRGRAVNRPKETKGRGQGAEGRGQGAEGRGQGAEGGGQGAEGPKERRQEEAESV